LTKGQDQAEGENKNGKISITGKNQKHR